MRFRKVKTSGRRPKSYGLIKEQSFTTVFLKDHRSIKMSPKDASLKKNETIVYRNLYGDFSALELAAA